MTSPNTNTTLLDAMIEGAVNFRDLGGHRAGDARVRPGRLYRAGMTHTITEAGLRTLVEQFGLRTVIDLRVARERDEEGLTQFSDHGMRHEHIPLADDVNAPEEIQRQRYEEMRSGTFDWAASYMRMAQTFPDAFRQVFELLAEEGTLPAVFHCTAGRDRTGVTAALVLRSLGVADDDIAADYALSGDLLLPHVHRFMRMPSPIPMTDEEMAGMLRTQASAMLAFLEALERVYGSFDAYLRHIGVGAALVQRLRAALLEPAA
jgi:protein tyrosine/serine phosphatase